MSERRKSDLTKLGNIIADSSQAGFLGLAKEMMRVFEVWSGAVGPYNAARAWPESVKGGRLTVLVESPAWIDHFNYFKSDFIQRLNQALGAEIVQDLAFRVGNIPLANKPPVPPAGRPTPAADERPRDDPEIQKAVAGIKDPELKARLAAFMARQKPAPPE
ncbi:MAG: DUF721 domain-containing protein [Thermodesulfobacteriota bacterium]